MQVVVFRIGREEYGFPIEDVKEIVLLQKRTSMPNMPPYFEGIVNLRGLVIPVLNLAEKFALQSAESDEDDAKLIVLNLEGDKQIAIKADEVSEILSVRDEDLEAPPELFAGRSDNYISKIIKHGERLIIVLDAANLISSEDLGKLEF